MPRMRAVKLTSLVAPETSSEGATWVSGARRWRRCAPSVSPLTAETAMGTSERTSLRRGRGNDDIARVGGFVLRRGFLRMGQAQAKAEVLATSNTAALKFILLSSCPGAGIVLLRPRTGPYSRPLPRATCPNR